tara:strand:+ start:142 stop:531 length:390 start_codon:yes stop_codon:yes gene_type:complete
MGYRSEVILAIDAKLVPALMVAFAKCEETQKLCTQYVDNLDTDYEGKGNWLMRWDHIKWYDSFPEIEMINNLIEGIECEDLSEFGLKDDESAPDYNEMFRFVRVGEDMDDNEVRGYGFDNIYISRSICV